MARSGLGWFFFFVGTTIGCIPWIIFSSNYYKVFKMYSLCIENATERKLYLFNQKIVLLFNILSALGMNGVAYFDMGNYPLTHMMVFDERNDNV